MLSTSDTSSSPHLVFVTTKPFFSNAGGGEKVLCAMASEFVNRGFKCTILCCDVQSTGKPFFPLDSRVQIINSFKGIPLFARQTFRNLRCLFLPELAKFDKRKKIESQWRAEAFKPIIENIHPTMYICQTLDAAYILKTVLKVDTPIITMYHLSPEQQVQKIKNRLIVKAANDCDAFQVLIPEFIPLCRPFLPDTNIVYIPNSVPQFERQSSLSEEKIICVSNFEPKQKRPALLVEAFALLHSEFPSWKLEFWGRPHSTYQRDVVKLIDRLNLKDSFLLCGTTTDIVAKLMSSSIFVFPSAYEGFGLALTEAMAAGLPCIGCNDCIAVRNLIQNEKNGLLTDPDPNSLASAIKRLIQDTNLRQKLGKQAREDMRQFAPKVVWDSWEVLIRKLILNKPNKT